MQQIRFKLESQDIAIICLTIGFLYTISLIFKYRFLNQTKKGLPKMQNPPIPPTPRQTNINHIIQSREAGKNKIMKMVEEIQDRDGKINFDGIRVVLLEEAIDSLNEAAELIQNTISTHHIQRVVKSSETHSLALILNTIRIEITKLKTHQTQYGQAIKDQEEKLNLSQKEFFNQEPNHGE